MPDPSSQLMRLFPEALLEQDFLVFLSFFGWMLIGLLAWTKPLAESKEDRSPWLWFGYFGISQAISAFIKILSFSDPFWREFPVESALEMLGYGMLIDFAIRHSKVYNGKGLPPYGSIFGLLLGFALEVNDVLYSQIVAALGVVVACAWAVACFAGEAKRQKRPQLYAIALGLALLIPAWFLDPHRIGLASIDSSLIDPGMPYYGFAYLAFRIAGAWAILWGFWTYRLQARIDDVARPVKKQLSFWGYRVMPCALAIIILASFLVTNWNGRLVQSTLQRDYIFRAETGALAFDPAINWQGEAQATAKFRAEEVLRGQLQAIQDIGTDFLSVYLWRGDDNQRDALYVDAADGRRSKLLPAARSLLERNERFLSNKAFLLGPIMQGGEALLNISAPVVDATTGLTAYWLGIDVSAAAWIESVSMARLQTLIIAGLCMALAIFFMYYQVARESEADLIFAVEKAEAQDRAKSEFLAVISHEIRTPLQSVLGYSNLLRATPLDEKQMSCLDTIQSEGKILLRIVQDILDFSNLRKASFELTEDKVNLPHLVNETYRTVAPMAKKRGLEAGLEIDDNLPSFIEGDAVRLRQVLLNLFGNSVKYTEEGSVSLAVKIAENDSIDPETHIALDFVISDTGIGIKEDDLKRLFEPFIQLEHTSKFPREGAGLGLAIVNRIVELMGGNIEVSSVVGEGSVFIAHFIFSVLPDEEDNEIVDTPGQLLIEEVELLGKQYPLKVLVADDNPMVRNLVGQYLESLGYEPTLVDGGKPASEQGPDYDLVIMDLRMPEVDGPQATALIREKTGEKDRPWIIGVSASLLGPEVERAREMGINDFLGKPFFEEPLAEKIGAIPWINEKAPVDSLPVVSEESTTEDESPTKGGMGIFSPEIAKQAADEVVQLSEEMTEALKRGEFDFVSEKAHYIANTAMALGIDNLYTDSKALENAAEEKNNSAAESELEKLKNRFKDWVTANF